MLFAAIRDARLKFRNHLTVVFGFLLVVVFSYSPTAQAVPIPVTTPMPTPVIVVVLSRGSVTEREPNVRVSPSPSPTPLPTPVPPTQGPVSYVFFPPKPVKPRITHALGWPMKGGRISQNFSLGHMAVDIAADCGTSVLASDGGTVTFAGWRNNGGGYVLEIDHGWAVTSYNHLGGFNASVGQVVQRGQTVAFVGTTGNSTGCHLHWAVLIGGVYVNALGLM